VKGIASFVAGAAVVVAVIAAGNWWLDPLGQFWDREVLEVATQRGCVISDDLVGTASWLPFKEQVFELRRPRRIVVGTSRVLKIGGVDDLANLGMPGTGIDTLAPFFRRLHAIDPSPLTVYLGVDLFWLNPTWQSNVVFEHGLRQDVKYVLARQTLSSSARLVREAPSAFRGWRVEKDGGECLVDRGKRLLHGEKDGWRADGSFVYRHELHGGGRIDDDEFERDLVRFDGPYYRDWRYVDHGRSLQLREALRQAASYGWDVVGFTPPYSSRYRRRLLTARETRGRVRQVAVDLPRIFHDHGFEYRDWRTFDCTDAEYVDDGWHPDERCAGKVLAALEDADVSG
jgi:hypothetical protein